MPDLIRHPVRRARQREPMEKRYQVFVSSTYKDLLEARQEVMRVLLESDCIPAGMELFPAADDDQWTLIKRVIDECDYYIVIIAGRYGSIGPEEKSFTQLEYEYAVSRKKPVIAFLHEKPGKLPADHTEKDPEQVKKLEDFRSLAQRKAVRYWTTPADLGSVVSRSLVKLIKDKPATGWVKADSLPSQEATQEIRELKGQVAELKRTLKTVRTTAPKETSPLAQGEDQFEIEYTYRLWGSWRYSASYSVSWSQIFARISPFMLDEVSDSYLKERLNYMTADANIASLEASVESRLKDGTLKYPHHEDFAPEHFYPHDFQIKNNTFDTIKFQLLALKLIKKSGRKNTWGLGNYWTLTPRGMTKMAELQAIRKTDSEESSPSPSKGATKARRSD